MNVKIGEQLFPVVGLTTEPTTPEDEIRLVGDVQPALALLAGKGPSGMVWVEATATGELKTADAGSGLEFVEPASGIATNTLADLALSNSFTRVIITVKNAPLQITYETSPGTYSGAVELAVGSHLRDMSAEDLQVANAISDLPSTYQVEAYR